MPQAFSAAAISAERTLVEPLATTGAVRAVVSRREAVVEVRAAARTLGVVVVAALLPLAPKAVSPAAAVRVDAAVMASR